MWDVVYGNASLRGRGCMYVGHGRISMNNGVPVHLVGGRATVGAYVADDRHIIKGNVIVHSPYDKQ